MSNIQCPNGVVRCLGFEVAIVRIIKRIVKKLDQYPMPIATLPGHWILDIDYWILKELYLYFNKDLNKLTLTF